MTNLFMKSGQVNIDKKYHDLCQKGDVNVAYINSRWIRINATSQEVNKKDFPIGPSKKWSVGKNDLNNSSSLNCQAPCDLVSAPVKFDFWILDCFGFGNGIGSRGTRLWTGA